MTEAAYLTVRLAVGLLFVFAGMREIARAMRARPTKDSPAGSLSRQLLSLKRLKMIRSFIGAVLIVRGLQTTLSGW